VSEIGIILKFAMPSGIPMIVMHSATPVITCAMASQMPAKMIQMMFPNVDPTPAVSRRMMVRPKGQRA
jgi:hypothetical protein